MKHILEVEVITGTLYASDPVEVSEEMMEVFGDLNKATYIKMPYNGQVLLLQPCHIVSVLFKETQE